MPSSIRANDILWTRTGDPALTRKIDENTGQVFLDKELSKVQDMTKTGLKNGLTVPQRDIYKANLSSTQSPDKKKEIEDLFSKIKSLKEANSDPRVIKYLENELQYRMIRESYTPLEYGINPVTLDI